MHAQMSQQLQLLPKLQPQRSLVAASREGAQACAEGRAGAEVEAGAGEGPGRDGDQKEVSGRRLREKSRDIAARARPPALARSPLSRAPAAYRSLA